MNRLIITFSAILCFAVGAIAQTEHTDRTLLPLLFQDGSANAAINVPNFISRQRVEAQEAQPQSVSIKTTHAGELAGLLGENATLIDELHVEGPINGEDFNIMWSSTLNGRLKVLDLGKATVENGIIPDYALFHTDEQVDWDAGIITTVRLEKLILPANTIEVGRSAFAYAIFLDEIVFPESLRKIGTASFTYCKRLATDPFVLPSNLEYIGYQAFYECNSLAGEVVLPQSMKVIDGAVFYHTRINKINIPESVEYLGDFAFYGCSLKDIYVPDGCHLDTRGCQFYCNHELEQARIPETCRQIPEDIFSNCINLKEVNIPAGTTHIWESAFESCIALECFSTLVLPEGLEAIGFRAFSENPIKEIVLPSTLSYIGAEVFGYGSKLERIYCKATEVPECHDWELRPGESPFFEVAKDIPVYVPKGTADSYRNAWGWNHFTNFIETESFPYTGIDDVTADETGLSGATYDLYGRKVNILTPGSVYIRDGKKFVHK